MGNEIRCAGCGDVVLARREPLYDGFKKVGEVVVCTACGHRHEPDETQAVQAQTRPAIFGADDLPERPNVFSAEERRRCCRYCRHYVISRFDQRCALTSKTVASTDLCFDFDRREDEEDGDEQD